MRVLVASMVALVGCGNDIGIPAIDAAGVGGPPGSPTIVVMGPRAGESFYPAQTATISWVATDDDTPSFPCDVAIFGGASIASAVATTSGATTSTPWSIAGVAPGSYRVQVTCTDANGLVGSGLSGTFQISDPPQAVSYATGVQPLWSRSCTGNQCHDSTMPAEGLVLTAGASYAALVGTQSSQCASAQLVEPGAPERSYLVMKLQGNGSCFIGSRMPKPPSTFSAEEVQRVRDWIFNGAPNN